MFEFVGVNNGGTMKGIMVRVYTIPRILHRLKHQFYRSTENAGPKLTDQIAWVETGYACTLQKQFTDTDKILFQFS